MRTSCRLGWGALPRALSSGAIAGFASNRQPYEAQSILPASPLHDTSEPSSRGSARTLTKKSVSITTELACLPVASTVASSELPPTTPSHCMPPCSLLPHHHAVPHAYHDPPATPTMPTAPVGLCYSGATLLRAEIKAHLAHVSSHFPTSCAAPATSAATYRDAVQSVTCSSLVTPPAVAALQSYSSHMPFHSHVSDP